MVWLRLVVQLTMSLWLAVVKEKQGADECIRERNRVVVVRRWLSIGGRRDAIGVPSRAISWW